MIVVDCSVAPQWVLDEPGPAASVELLTGDDDLVAPDIILVEVAKVLAKKVRQGRIAAEQLVKGARAGGLGRLVRHAGATAS